MKKHLIAAILGSTAMMGIAYAQQATDPAQQNDPAMQPQETETAPETNANQQDDQQPGAAQARAQDQGGFLVWQDQDQMIASNLMGADVWGAENESIGSVDDLLLDREGRIIAVIVGVGGFLGIGEKDVAISNDQLEFVLTQDVQATDAPGAGDPAAPGTATQDQAAAPAQPAPADGGGTVPAPAAGADPDQTGAAGTTPPAGTMAPGTGQQGYGTTGAWGWTGAGINHIQVNFTRAQLEAAPEFRAAE